MNKKVDPFLVQKERRSSKLLGFSKRLEWTENSFVSTGKNVDIIGLSFSYARAKFIIGFFLVFIIIIFSRVFFIQIVQKNYYHSISSGNRIRIKKIEANRGILYDRNRIPMVRNVASFMLYLTPIDLPGDDNERNQLIGRIVDILNFSNENKILVKDVEDKLSKVKRGSLESYQPLFIEDDISHNSAMLLYLETQKMPGVSLVQKDRRHYLIDIDTPIKVASTTNNKTKYIIKNENRRVESLSHILGYIGKINKEEFEKYGNKYSSIDYIGKTGLEHALEEELRGLKGKKQVEVDALGKERRVISSDDANNGYNLILSLDVKLQAKIEEIVKRHLEELKLHNAAVVAMDPRNGEILALVSIPGFDNNAFSGGISSKNYKSIINDDDKSLFNRAIKGEYPSGSTIKPVMLASALQERVISEWTNINSTGGVRINKWFFPDWKQGGHGLTNAKKAIAQSVNTYFYYIGGGYEDFIGLGIKRILEYDAKFGLGSPTGIDLSGESGGFLPSKQWKREKFDEPWYIGDTYHLSIGQGFLLTTPLQVANFTSFFANNGILYKPRLLKKIERDNGDFVKEKMPEVIKKDFIDAYNVKVVKEGMRQTVTIGSARSLNALSVKVAGKTGTAQWSSNKTPHAWFTCFAPYKNPEIVLTVLVEEGGEGTYVSVPIVKEILEYYFE